MKHRGSLPKNERMLRSRLHRILSDKDGFIHGSIINMARCCGNPNCKCATKDQKHVSVYLGQTKNGKTRMKSVPKAWEGRIKRWVRNYKQVDEILEKLSEECWQRLLQNKE
jgi:hypothetical protein